MCLWGAESEKIYLIYVQQIHRIMSWHVKWPRLSCEDQIERVAPLKGTADALYRIWTSRVGPEVGNFGYKENCKALKDMLGVRWLNRPVALFEKGMVWFSPHPRLLSSVWYRRTASCTGVVRFRRSRVGWVRSVTTGRESRFLLPKRRLIHGVPVIRGSTSYSVTLDPVS